MSDLWSNWWCLGQFCSILNLCKVRVLGDEHMGQIWGFHEIVDYDSPNGLNRAYLCISLVHFQETSLRMTLTRFASFVALEHRMDAQGNDVNDEKVRVARMPRTWSEALEDPIFSSIANPRAHEFDVLEQEDDPGKFVVPCIIWGMVIERAIADTGAGINVITSCLTENIPKDMIEHHETRITLVDSSSRAPKGIMKGFPVMVHGVMVPTDFVIIDSIKGCGNTPRVVLGRPFLSTVGAILNFHSRKMIFKNLDNIAIPMEVKGDDDLVSVFCGMLGRGKKHKTPKDPMDASSGIYPTDVPTQEVEDLADGVNHFEMNPQHLVETVIISNEDSGVESSRQDFIELLKELEMSLSTRPKADHSFHKLHKSLESMIKESSEDPNFKLPNLGSYLSGFLVGASGSGKDKGKSNECFLLDDDEPPRELSELEKVTGYWHSIQTNTPAWEERFFLSTSDYISKEAHEVEVAKLYKKVYPPPSMKGKEKVSSSQGHIEVPKEEKQEYIEMPKGYGWYSSPIERRIEESTKISNKGKQPLPRFNSYPKD